MKKVKIPKVNLNLARIKQIDKKTILGLMSYLQILVIFPAFIARRREFVIFHAKQGVALLMVWILLLFSFYIPLLPWLLAIFIAYCIVLGFLNVLTGKEKALPFIGRFGERLSW